MKPVRLMVSVAGLGILSLIAAPHVTFAKTVASLTVNHNVYLIQTPEVGSPHIALEPAGTQLTAEPGGTSYWWHVKDPSGRDGYVTTGSYYVTEPSNLDIQVTHATNLVAAPVSGTGRIAREQSGSLLTIEPGGNAYWWHAKDANGNNGYIRTKPYYTTAVANLARIPYPSLTPMRQTTTFKLPPGVQLDSSITPLAKTSATNEAKFEAILRVARSKLGTPYVWGHNEDRGQVGFDCSNFVEYVYHHALGYSFSTSSTVQYTSIGTSIAKSNMQPGDLLAFNNGGHTGIYIGEDWMVQCGGGLGKVGYLYIGPGTYWTSHLSAVKRMF